MEVTYDVKEIIYWHWSCNGSPKIVNSMPPWAGVLVQWHGRAYMVSSFLVTPFFFQIHRSGKLSIQWRLYQKFKIICLLGHGLWGTWCKGWVGVKCVSVKYLYHKMDNILFLLNESYIMVAYSAPTCKKKSYVNVRLNYLCQHATKIHWYAA